MAAKFQILYSFERDPQKIDYLNLEGRPSEAETVFRILGGMTPQQRGMLRKLSLFQYDAAQDGVLSWVAEGDCKYYFGVEKS